MKTKLAINRTSQHVLRVPLGVSPTDADEQSARKFYYDRLMQVSVQHTYYNRSDNQCPDFDFKPTPSSIALMNDLGLLFRSEATGFSILYDQKRKDSLQQYLRRQLEGDKHNSPPQPGWPKLSFVLYPTNHYFINFTDLPLDTNPGQQNFYFSNQFAQAGPGDEIILNRGAYVGDPAQGGLQELLKTVPVRFPVEVDEAVDEVHVSDITGEVIICEPRCVAVSSAANGASAALNEEGKAALSSPPKLQCRESIFLDFAQYPEGKYTIEKIFQPGSHPSAAAKSKAKQDVLYTTSSPLPLCFIDLLFTDPTGKDGDTYPVTKLFPAKETEIKAVHYQLKFKARSTFWGYYIVPQPNRADLKDLRIESTGPPHSSRINFNGPCRVYLANGTQGYRFISDKAIPLRQIPEFRLRLMGRHSLMPHGAVILENLPMASRQQVLRDEISVLLDASANLCPRSSDARCRKLIRRLGKCLCPGRAFNKELEQLKQDCENPSGQKCAALRQRCPNLYSDTYVYV
jgi:hypothetical protein